MTLDSLPLPPGWIATNGEGYDEGVVFVRNPSSHVVGNMHQRGAFSILGCTTPKQVDACLRVMFPHYGIRYPHHSAEQLTLL